MVAPLDELCRLDPRFEALRARYGDVELTASPVTYDSIARAIVFQQLSGKAATTIWNRLKVGLGGSEAEPLDHSLVVTQSIESLRPFGLSRQKASYLLDLSLRTDAGAIHFAKFNSMPDEAIIEELTQVKGIGLWSVQMVLMFSLARPNVWPALDLGVRHGMRILENLPEIPKPKQAEAMGDRWAPLRSYAAMYMWRIKDGD